MADTPSTRNGAQAGENGRKKAFLNYESPALTAELQAHLNYRVKHNTSLVTNPESIRDCSNSEFLVSKPLSYRPTAPLRGERLTFSKDRLCL